MRKSAAGIAPQQVGEPPVIAFRARVRREQMRWLLLLHLDEARPQGVTDLALLALLQTVYPDATIHEVQRDLHYLALQNLLTVNDKAARWLLALTYQGIDIVEYTSSCPQGIGRPAVAPD